MMGGVPADVPDEFGEQLFLAADVVVEPWSGDPVGVGDACRVAPSYPRGCMGHAVLRWPEESPIWPAPGCGLRHPAPGPGPREAARDGPRTGPASRRLTAGLVRRRQVPAAGIVRLLA